MVVGGPAGGSLEMHEWAREHVADLIATCVY